MKLLSICIPTYNRADILDKSLQSIVKQPLFNTTDWVDIVVSDNCSTDKTEAIVKKYIKVYGDKIKYFRNSENVQDKNFSLVLSKGTGAFLKLCNDTMCWEPNSLKEMIDIIKKHLSEKPVLFFMNGSDKKATCCISMNDFVQTVSFLSTWIGGFGIWQEDKHYLNEMETYSETRLSQTGVLLKMIHDKKSAQVISNKIYEPLIPSQKGNYNLSEIFIQNYLSFYQPYLVSEELNAKIYEKECWLVFKRHVLPRQFNIKSQFIYDKSGFWKYTKRYHKHPKFYFLICKALIKKGKYFIKKKVHLC